MLRVLPDNEHLRSAGVGAAWAPVIEIVSPGVSTSESLASRSDTPGLQKADISHHATGGKV
jgi:hypothetical protein